MTASVFASETAGGTEPPVLLLHELGGSHRSFRWMVEELDGVRTIAADTPGSGASPTLAEGSGLADYAEIFAAFVREQVGRPVVVVGIAFGAAVGTVMAARHPDTVAGLVYCCMGPEIEPHTRTFLEERCLRVLREGVGPSVDVSLENSYPPAARAGREDVYEAYRRDLCATRVDGYVNQSRALANAGATVAEHLPRVAAPIHVVTGAHDRHFTPKVVERIRAMAPSATGLSTIAESGHLPNVQAPRQLAAIVRDFQRGLTGSRT